MVMRRRHRNFRAFANGLLLAGLPVAAFIGVDWLFAPPAGTQPSGAPVAAESVVEGLARVARGVTATPRTSELARTTGQLETVSVGGMSTAEFPRASSGRGEGAATLVLAIQTELARVGCYGGAADGAWSDRTRSAMRAFNSSVHVTLPTEKPDYILLTLLQGHSAKACSRTCDGDARSGEACIDKSIEARAVAPVTLPMSVPKRVLADRGGQVLPTSSVAAVAPATHAVPRPQVAPQAISSAPALPPPTVAEIAPPRQTGNPAESFPGRMTVGALPSGQEALPLADPTPTVAARAPVDVAPHQARPQHSSASSASRPRSNGGSGSGGSRFSRTFTELSRTAP